MKFKNIKQKIFNSKFSENKKTHTYSKSELKLEYQPLYSTRINRTRIYDFNLANSTFEGKKAKAPIVRPTVLKTINHRRCVSKNEEPHILNSDTFLMKLKLSNNFTDQSKNIISKEKDHFVLKVEELKSQSEEEVEKNSEILVDELKSISHSSESFINNGLSQFDNSSPLSCRKETKSQPVTFQTPKMFAREIKECVLLQEDSGSFSACLQFDSPSSSAKKAENKGITPKSQFKQIENTIDQLAELEYINTSDLRRGRNVKNYRRSDKNKSRVNFDREEKLEEKKEILQNLLKKIDN